MNQMNDKQKKLSKWIALGIAAVTIGVLAPFVFLVLQSTLALIATLVLGLAAINLAPWFSIKMATWSLKLIKSDAEANPVETRLQIEMATDAALQKSMSEIETFESEVGSFDRKVQALSARYPTKTQQYQDQLLGMQRLLKLRRAKWHEARDGLIRYKDETEEISALWDMAQSAKRMNILARKAGGPDPMQEFRTRVANDTVYKGMDLAMAQLSTALMEASPSVNEIDITPAPLALGIESNNFNVSDFAKHKNEAQYVSNNR